MDLEETLLKLHSEKPDYFHILKRCCEAQRRVCHQAYWLGFEHTDIKVDGDLKLAMGIPRRLSILSTLGLLELSFHSNSSTCYKVPNIQEVERILADIEKAEAMSKLEPTFSREVEMPGDLFSTIVGYEDIKALFKRVLRAERFHILLCGSPASAKTLFLLELARLDSSFYCIGSTTTKAGLAEIFYEQRPKILLADEIDKFETKDIAILLSLAETGIVRETKFGKQREVRLNTNIFAASNTIKGMTGEFLSRFRVLHLPEYTQRQFMEASINVLMERESINYDLASYIAERTWDISKDIREAVRIGKICHTKEQVDGDLKLLRKYGGKCEKD